jgi:hypothetical protein
MQIISKRIPFAGQYRSPGVRRSRQARTLCGFWSRDATVDAPVLERPAVRLTTSAKSIPKKRPAGLVGKRPMDSPSHMVGKMFSFSEKVPIGYNTPCI